MAFLEVLAGVGTILGATKKSPKAASTDQQDSTVGEKGQASTAATETSVGSSTQGTVSNGSQTTTGNTNTNTSESGQSLTNNISSVLGTGTSNNVSSSINNSIESGNSSTSNVGTTSQTGVTQQSTSNFSDPLMSQLDGLLSGAISNGGTAQSQNALKDRLTQLGGLSANFIDPTAYAAGVTESAGRRLDNNLTADLNGFASQTGVAGGSNSMLALLGNQMRGDNAATLSGINADAMVKASGLRTQQESDLTSQIGAITGQSGRMLTDLVKSLSGARQTTTGQQATTGITTDLGKQATESVGTQTGTVRDTGSTTSTTQSNDRSTTQSSNDSNTNQTNNQSVLDSLSSMVTGTTNNSTIANQNSTNSSLTDTNMKNKDGSDTDLINSLKGLLGVAAPAPTTAPTSPVTSLPTSGPKKQPLHEKPS